MLVGSVEEEIETSKHHADVEQDRGYGQAVERESVFLETLKEARSHLQAYHEDKQDESEILAEIEDGSRGREMDMSGYDASEENKSDAQRNAEHLYFPQIHAHGNNNSIEQYDVGDGFIGCEKINKPIHFLAEVIKTPAKLLKLCSKK